MALLDGPMSLRSFGKGLNEFAGERIGAKLVRTQTLYPWQRQPAKPGTFQADTVPDSARDYLRHDNPRLAELKRRYSAVDRRVTTPASWVENKLHAHDLLYFRGDNAFVWQIRDRNHNELSYALVYYALKSGPCGALLDRLGEDPLFGVNLFEVDGVPVSRDLLDSARFATISSEKRRIAGLRIDVTISSNSTPSSSLPPSTTVRSRSPSMGDWTPKPSTGR